MRLSPLTSRGRVEDEDSAATGRSRSGRVRMSILSKELLILAGLLGGVGYVVVADHGTEPAHHAGMSTLRGHEGVIESLAFASDGKTLVSCGWDRTVRTWDGGRGPVRVGEGDPDILASNVHLFSVSISPDGKYLAAGGTDCAPRLEPRSGVAVEAGRHQRPGEPPCPGDVPRWRPLALGCGDGSIKLWELSGRKEVGVLERILRRTAEDRIFSGRTSPWRDFLRRRVHGLGPVPGSPPRRHPLQPEKVQSFAFAADNRTVAIAQWSPDLRSLASGIWKPGTACYNSRTTRTG